MSKPNHRQRLVQLARAHTNNDHFMSSLKKEKIETWEQVLSDQIDELAEEEKEIIRRQASGSNAAKPIGLFLGDDSLVTEQDETILRKSSHKQRQSLIESCVYWAQEDDRVWNDKHYWDYVSEEHVISLGIKLIEASALPNPSLPIDQYVTNQVKLIAVNDPRIRASQR